MVMLRREEKEVGNSMDFLVKVGLSKLSKVITYS
jgi:hypothetical protein